MQPAIILVSQNHADFLADEFGRYRRDYDIHAVTIGERRRRPGPRDPGERRTGRAVRLRVVLPDSDVYMAFHLLAQVVPTARRLVVAHWERFLDRRRAGCARAWPRASTTPSC